MGSVCASEEAYGGGTKVLRGVRWGVGFARACIGTQSSTLYAPLVPCSSVEQGGQHTQLVSCMHAEQVLHAESRALCACIQFHMHEVERFVYWPVPCTRSSTFWMRGQFCMHDEQCSPCMWPILHIHDLFNTRSSTWTSTLYACNWVSAKLRAKCA